MAQNDKAKGVWLISTDGQIIPENSEINALRTAVSTGGKLEFVKYGDTLGNPTPDVDLTPAFPVTKAEPKAKPETTPEASDY